MVLIRSITSLFPKKLRRHERFPLKQAPLDFAYSFTADLDILPFIRKQKESAPAQCRATAENVSAEGVCFRSQQKLKKGQTLDLKFYIPGGRPVSLRGRVRWSRAVPLSEGDFVYATGVRLTTIDGYPVHSSVHFDRRHQVYWSNVLESILGEFKTIQKESKSSP